MIQIKEHEMIKLAGFVQNHFGINLTEKRNLVEGRLAKHLSDLGIESFEEYFDLVVSDTSCSEISFLIDKLTTNHTFFMRESSHFDYFRDTVLPWLSRMVKDYDLRIWCAGCSTGEEPYTLAMILSDYFGNEKYLWDMKILATDISTTALETAREGIYKSDAVQTLPKAWQLSYFKPIGGQRFQVCDAIRDQVVYRSFNLMEKTLPFKKQFHVIFCRNVMIYFNQETKNQLIQRYYNHTCPGGYLFIGHTESLAQETMGYHYVQPSVYRK